MMKRLISRNSFDAETEEARLEKQPKLTRQFLLGYPGKDIGIQIVKYGFNQSS